MKHLALICWDDNLEILGQLYNVTRNACFHTQLQITKLATIGRVDSEILYSTFAEILGWGRSWDQENRSNAQSDFK